MTLLQKTAKSLAILWASPYSLLGLSVGFVGCLTGGQARFRDHAIEFYGGGTRWMVRRLPLGERTAGITLGHVILGQTSDGLVRIGAHERVHVRQFERWGLLMGPAYFLASLWVWSRGKHIYWDNPFEKEAYAKAP
ncbi:MAG: hypothetical protein AAGG44_06400 [Planctomycetota bacterium]